MTVGLSAANLANKFLSVLAGTSFTAPTTVYLKLHTGDPGSAGTANASANTTRVAVTWGTPSGGSMSIAATFPAWASWAAGSETETHISVWDASTGGNFLYSCALLAPKAMTNGDTLTLTSHTFALTPIAA